MAASYYGFDEVAWLLLQKGARADIKVPKHGTALYLDLSGGGRPSNRGIRGPLSLIKMLLCMVIQRSWRSYCEKEQVTMPKGTCGVLHLKLKCTRVMKTL